MALLGMDATDLLFDLDFYYSSTFPIDVWMFVDLFGVDKEDHLIACWNMIKNSHLPKILACFASIVKYPRIIPMVAFDVVFLT